MSERIRAGRRSGLHDDMLRVAVLSASAGARVLVVSTKDEAKRTHAAIDRLRDETWSRDGDTWHIGAGPLEVRAT